MRNSFLDHCPRFIASFGAIFCLCLPALAVTPEGKTLEASKTPVQIANDGKALVPIVISPQSSEAIKKTAGELAGYLKRISKGKANGQLISLPVKAGMDGKVWSINGKFRNLWFLDIPTVLSSSSDRIFVPKEVAEKDRLKVVL